MKSLRLPILLPFLLIITLTLLTLFPLHPYQVLSHLSSLPPPCPLLLLTLSPPALCCHRATTSSPNCKSLSPRKNNLKSLLRSSSTFSPFNYLLLPTSPSNYVCLHRLHVYLSNYPVTTPFFLYLPLNNTFNQSFLLPNSQPYPPHPFLLAISRAALPTLLSVPLPRRPATKSNQQQQPIAYTKLINTLFKRPVLLPVPIPSYPQAWNCSLPPKTSVITDVTDQSLCTTTNKAQCRLATKTPSHDLAFLILPVAVRQAPAALYTSIRHIFPSHQILVADISRRGDYGKRLLKSIKRRDRNLQIVRTFPHRNATVRNLLVSAASAKYVVFLPDAAVLAPETRLGVMVSMLERSNVDIVGGRLLRNGGYVGRLGDEALVAEEAVVGFRYGFGDEMVLRRETIGAAQFEGRDCFRAHRTSDFLVAKRELLEMHAWRGEFGSLSNDEFFIRVMRKELKVAVCDSGVKFRFAEAVKWEDRLERVWENVFQDVKQVCEAWERELGDIGGLMGRDLEFDCVRKKVCERTEKMGGNGTEFEKDWMCREWK